MDRTETGVGQVKIASGLNILFGLWLIIAPFLLSYSAMRAAMWDDIIIGAVILVLAWVRVANPARYTWLSWSNVVLGLWLIAAPFVLGSASVTAALWNDIIVGVIVASLAIWSAFSTRTISHA
ncbi:MAG TPA: hypothetical protein DEP84_36035 [Chloroflexi bacterium]|nr:hypothetical protein [Chloroflexota bacterium]